MTLYYKIISGGYYWNGLINSCKEIINNCLLCNTKNSTIFMPPNSNKIICIKPRELYVFDITQLSHEYLNDESHKIFLLSGIDHFSKYGYNFLIKKKEENTVLQHIKKFIKFNGILKRILCDNGKEFLNKKFTKFFK